MKFSYVTLIFAILQNGLIIEILGVYSRALYEVDLDPKWTVGNCSTIVR